MPNPDSKTQYLIEFRNGLWAAIRHKEGGIWQFVSFFAAAIVIVGGLLQGDRLSTIGPTEISIVSLVLLLGTFWGIVIVLDANFWMARNLWFISNIEWSILGEPEIGTIIPKAYATPGFRYSRAYSIHVQVFCFAALCMIIGEGMFLLPAGSLQTSVEFALSALVSLAFSLGLWVLLDRDQAWVGDYARVQHDAPGPKSSRPSFEPLPLPIELAKQRMNSPVTRWGWALAFAGGGVLLVSAYSNQSWISRSPTTASSVLLVALIAGAVGFATIGHLGKRLAARIGGNREPEHAKGDPQPPESGDAVRIAGIVEWAMKAVLVAVAGSWGLLLLGRSLIP